MKAIENTDDNVWSDLTIAVPVYSRPAELRQLLASIAAMTILPAEVLLCEDMSPHRQLLSRIAAEWKEGLAAKGCSLQYIENPYNLGYDANVRNLFEKATRTWVMLLGNDDAMLPDALPAVHRFILANPHIRMVSRTYVLFSGDIEHVVRITKLSGLDHVYSRENSQPGLILRLCGFLGGLIIDRAWACSIATDRYDGTLYYQMYLAAVAFSVEGIGYIATPLVGSRLGNCPMFGSAASEKGVHVPGAYSPIARAAMWKGILRICADVEKETLLPMMESIRWELAGRQSFNVFEMIAIQGRHATLALVRELRQLRLMGHPLPWFLSLVCLLMGGSSHRVFSVVRMAQKWRSRRNS